MVWNEIEGSVQEVMNEGAFVGGLFVGRRENDLKCVHENSLIRLAI